MSKLTSLAIGLLTAISILPASQAMAAIGNTSVIPQPSGDLHAQIVVKIGPQIRREPVYYDSDWAARRRQREWERVREARARWEAERRHYRQSRYHQHRDYRNDYRDDYRDDYRKDRYYR